jgi:hypothetical protein
MTVGTLQNTSRLFDASIRNMPSPIIVQTTATSRFAPLVPIAFIVGLVALALLSPIIAPIVETASRIVCSPLLALHRIVVLEYTLFKHKPSEFIKTAIKANFLFFKGFILEQFLPKISLFNDCEKLSRAAYAEMFLLSIDNSENLNPEAVERGFRFPSLFECALDLGTINRVEFFATGGGQPVAQQLEQDSPKFAPYHIRNDYFQNRVASVDIPQLPEGANLQNLVDQLLGYIDASWPESLEINDDGVSRSKSFMVARIRNYFNNDNIYHPATNQTLRRTLGHVLLHFIQRKESIESLPVKSLRKKAVQAWLGDCRAFLMSLSATLSHCVDRRMTDAFIYYVRYVQRKPINPEMVATSRLEVQIFDLLKRLRQDLIQHVCSNLIETNTQHIHTERYIKSELNLELGLGLPGALREEESLMYHSAIREKVAEARTLFYRTYTPQSIVRHFISELTKQMRENQRDQLYMKIVEWFERQDPPRNAEDIFDPDELAFKEDAIIELFKKLRIIE